MRNRLLLVTAFLLALPAAAWANSVERALPIEIHGFQFAHEVIVVSAVVAVLILLFCWWLGRGLSKDNPGKGQMLLEMIVGMFDDLLRQSLGPTRGRRYLPWIGTLFLFLWTCNMIGLVPFPHMQIGEEPWEDYNHNAVYDPGEPWTDTNRNGVHDPGFPLPAFEEPTSNLNVPLGMALLFVLLIGHGSEIRYHGILGYLKGYFSPGGVIGVLMFPLNVVSKIAEIVSISFRLFGNIFGGVVIITVIGSLLHYVLIPIPLYGFFGIFVGTVQAFVFTMLAMTYISMGASEEED